LLIAEHWLGPRSDLFNIAIQAGAILAVVLVYRQRLMDLFVTNFGIPSNRDYLLKLLLAFAVTTAGGLAVKKFGFELPEEVTPIAWLSSSEVFAILLVEYVVAKRPPNSDITWKVAAWVGACQVLAGVFPGTSRSAATIFAAMLAGTTSRPAAAEFAFLVVSRRCLVQLRTSCLSSVELMVSPASIGNRWGSALSYRRWLLS